MWRITNEKKRHRWAIHLDTGSVLHVKAADVELTTDDETGQVTSHKIIDIKGPYPIYIDSRTIIAVTLEG